MRLRGRKALDGLKDDLHDHLARQTEENVARGMTPEEARRQAFLALGNLTMIEEDTRAVWVWRWLDGLRQDVRYALRTFRRDWVFSTVALLTLTLGIGAATAIFSIVYAVTLKPLPYGDAAGLVQVSNNDRAFLSIEEYEALVAQASALSGVAAAKVEMSAIPGPDGDINIPDYACTLNLFDVLGVRPELGRTFAPVDADQHVAVLDHEWWMHQFGGDPAVLGRSITLDDTPYQVIGVMPGGFRFPFRRPANVWIPADAEARAHSGGNWQTVGRMRRSASIADARAELAVISGRFAAEDPQRYAHMALTVEPLLDAVVGVATRTRLLVLLGAVGCVLVIACVNVASLLLTRSRSRVRELAVRTAIGAGRGRLLRQLLTEAVLTAILGGAAGIVVAHWMLGAIVGLIPSSVPRLGSIAIDDTVLLVACLLSLASGLTTGLMPAWLASRSDVHHALKDGAPMTTPPGASRAGALFVFAETSLALVLLIGAGLMIHSFDLLNQIDPGFAASHLVTIDLKGHPPPARIRDVLQRARSLPGVRDASGADDVPFEGGGARTTIEVQGRPQPPFDPSNTATVERALPGYFHMLGIGLLRGREFSDQDVNGAPLVALINEAAAKKYFPTENPIGLRLYGGDGWYAVVGIAKDVRWSSLADDAPAAVYFPLLQGNAWRFRGLTLLVRTDPAARVSLQNIRAEAAVIAGGADAIDDVQSMDAMIARSIQQWRFQAMQLGMFGALALIIAVVGIFGVTSYTVVQRTREIGVRLALGAQRSDMLRLILGGTARPVLAGLVVGLFSAVIATRTLAAFLFHITPTDAPTYGVTAGLFLVVALLASTIPAYRATRVDPVVTLRQD